MTRDRPPEDDWIFDPAIASLDRSLQREMRAEAREVEESMAASELRARSFADLALEVRNRGDVVSVATQRRTFQGQLRFAAKDFVTVESATFEVDLNIIAIDYLRIVEPGRSGGGRALLPGPGTFEMRLLERESPTEKVEIGFQFRDEVLMGQVVTVAQDHIIVVDDQRNQWVIPTQSVAFIVRRPQRRMNRL